MILQQIVNLRPALQRPIRILQSTVDLVRDGRLRPSSPVTARLSNRGRHLVLFDFVRLDNKLQEEALGGMPSDVAVERPDTFEFPKSAWIVGSGVKRGAKVNVSPGLTGSNCKTI